MASGGLEWKITDGLTPYPDAVSAMERRVADILAGSHPEQVWLVEHPPLYTAGTGAKGSDLLSPSFPVYQAGRGGQYTYHGPGQQVAYLMLNLKARGRMDVRAYVANLEQWLISTLAELGVEGFVREGRVGVWTLDKTGKESKIAAIGIRIRQWVTYHGICINIDPDLAHYTGIVPCGIREFGVTSLRALGSDASIEDVQDTLKRTFPF